MDFRPTLRMQPSSPDLTLQPSPDAYGLARAYRERGSAVKEPEVVREEAKGRIREAGGDPRCWQLVLSESELQFGQYWGQTFKWLLSHDVGYAAASVASHQKEREGGDTSQSPLAAHKDALTSYVQLFPEVVAAVQWTRRREGSLSMRDVDQELVGFSAHARETYRSLYESTSSESQTYVQWVRTMSVEPGSKRHNLQVYVLGRDREDGAAPSAQPGAPQPAASGAGAADPELMDSELVAAAMEVDSQLSSSSSDAPPAPALPPPQPGPARVTADDAPPPRTSGAQASSSHSDPEPHPKPIKEEEEDEGDVRGADGHGGYQHTVRLAHALVDLRHQAFVTQRQVREITALWQKLSDRDKAAISFPPRHQGRFKTKRAHMSASGVGSATRLFLGKGASVAQSPDATRLVEAIFLELRRIHSENQNIAGVRHSRWSAVRRDYSLIRDNMHSCKDLLAAAPIQLFEVNQRTLLQWHTKRSKAMMTSTVAAALPQVKAEETDHHLPEDASGLAVTRRGPLAPELHKLLSDPGATAASSSSSALPGAASSSTDASSASTAAAAATSSSLTPAPTTAWQRKMREEQRRRAEEQGALLRPPRKLFIKFNCRHCGQPKTRQYGHSRYGAEHYCAQVGGRSVEEWLQEKRAAGPLKTSVTQHPPTTHPATSQNLPPPARGHRRILPKPPPPQSDSSSLPPSQVTADRADHHGPSQVSQARAPPPPRRPPQARPPPPPQSLVSKRRSVRKRMENKKTKDGEPGQSSSTTTVSVSGSDPSSAQRAAGRFGRRGTGRSCPRPLAA